ncbi:hypothetical protein SERIO_v1c03700 [Spiroplasma eriocheiris]|uniref:Uncharacterized protein n=1 Tax=Spiroplasma eriocheiris TaxID=315358 RepID=A0A0H3XM58_9MOLU|nr:hypothetical protein SERIO_v1c03700 [Spiroplasma eriocheiris]
MFTLPIQRNLFHQLVWELNEIIKVEVAFSNLNPIMALKIELYYVKKTK